MCIYEKAHFNETWVFNFVGLKEVTYLPETEDEYLEFLVYTRPSRTCEGLLGREIYPH